MRGRKGSKGDGLGTPRPVASATPMLASLSTKAAPNDQAMEGITPRRRFDRPGRRLGGRTGADVAPLSTAGKTIEPPQPGHVRD